MYVLGFTCKFPCSSLDLLVNTCQVFFSHFFFSQIFLFHLITILTSPGLKKPVERRLWVDLVVISLATSKKISSFGMNLLVNVFKALLTTSLSLSSFLFYYFIILLFFYLFIISSNPFSQLDSWTLERRKGSLSHLDGQNVFP